MENIYVARNGMRTDQPEVQGAIVQIGNASYYKISHYDRMTPFLMNIVSDSDLWMFISSTGALTAGRRDADNALFPYYTDDRIHDSKEITGSKTVFLVKKADRLMLWEPFSDCQGGVYHIERNLYKNIVSNQLIFEEINFDLNLTFTYAWLNCDRFGFVKKSTLCNNSDSATQIELLDGVQNILPAGVSRKFQLEYSTLADGYKKSELLGPTRLALYTMSSLPTDKAEPNEALCTNTAWSCGVQNATILLSSNQVASFKRGLPLQRETDIKATRGAYFVQAPLQLAGEETKTWYLVADVNKNHGQIAALNRFLSETPNPGQILEQEVAKDTDNLALMIAQADGNQLGADKPKMFRHQSNILFNILRGGIFDDGYTVSRDDFIAFIKTADVRVAEKHKTMLAELPVRLSISDLFKKAESSEPGFEKLCHEYLPLTFSRRHGDPSRPWNFFSIITKDEHGNKKLNYEGNWRDIFQNWEALAVSFPEYIESMISKFVNASTADGYNPYRLTRDGLEWEELNLEDEWSYIGYWGDHQIIYLLKLLELSSKFHPGRLQNLLQKQIFTYANVPYRIKHYQDILKDPHDTIDFDFELDAAIQERVKAIGTNGKQVCTASGELYYVNLTEKLLLPLLVKLSNFIPEAGIWMNTQRPEWNDANNALVGFGTSMVTVYYSRRYLDFCIDLFERVEAQEIPVSEEVLQLFQSIHSCLVKNTSLLNASISDHERKQMTDQLGVAGSEHRLAIYRAGFSGKKAGLVLKELISFFRLSLQYIDHSIRANQRDDALYHAYNLIKVDQEKGIQIRHMYEMLEGQVAVLSSGYVQHDEVLLLLQALRNSSLYRPDQQSYLLYPNRELPRFTEKNIIPEKVLNKSTFLTAMLDKGDRRLVYRDVDGKVHFKSQFGNSRLLREFLEQLNEPELSPTEAGIILDVYETIYDHKSFTGRSGTFYKYEGLGSIYWHMVSKLQLAVQESFFRALDAGADAQVLLSLKQAYYEIQTGIGVHKNPNLYGAFPTDAYSHTPQFSGAQQPGMTGQVKEDLLSALGEKGVRIRDGKIVFMPALLSPDAFVNGTERFEYIDVLGTKKSKELTPGMLAFTFCQVPVTYALAELDKIIVTRSNGKTVPVEGLEIPEEFCNSLFRRDNQIESVDVFIRHGQIR